MDGYDLIEVLAGLDPSALDYTEWTQVGMALKLEGYQVAVWDEWSARDPKRYHRGECEKKWASFDGAAVPVTAGTIVQLAREHGWQPADEPLEWDSVIGGHKDELQFIQKGWVEAREVEIPDDWDPVQQLKTYLETLFEAGEIVGYVTESYQNSDGRCLPTKGSYSYTAGELLQRLDKYKNIGEALGDYNEAAGAWIRFNPLDGNGVRNSNVTDYRYALVESDSMEIDKQNAILRELELPIACLVHSGKKSLHAIVRVEAGNYDEYRKRVEYLYSVCKKNGLDMDTQNKNPSRLSRMPGVMRNGQKQYLIATNLGKSSWREWQEWVEAINDDLPDTENIESLWDDLPPLADELIAGVLRQGHKMLLAGPSKAGKSFALIKLCIAIAEGTDWFGFPCAQGKVLYVNLELDRASCLHRFKDVYTALRLQPEHLQNIDVWNLRGKSIPMDKLAPKLIRRAAKKDYKAVIIDPIYKVLTGDENSANEMSRFCNQFDKVCYELGCSVIYCHHHSKGAQGGKISMDRASGSGVFARDPDAMLDMIELPQSEAMINRQSEQIEKDVYLTYLTRFGHDVGASAACDEIKQQAQKLLNANTLSLASAEILNAMTVLHSRTAWRLTGTLREFQSFDAVDSWFQYPVHVLDRQGLLKGAKPDNGFNSKNSPWGENFGKQRSKEERAEDMKKSFFDAFETVLERDGVVTVKSMAEVTGKTERWMRSEAKKYNFGNQNGVLYKTKGTEIIE